MMAPDAGPRSGGPGSDAGRGFLGSRAGGNLDGYGAVGGKTLRGPGSVFWNLGLGRSAGRFRLVAHPSLGRHSPPQSPVEPDGTRAGELSALVTADRRGCDDLPTRSPAAAPAARRAWSPLCRLPQD